jgi:hypothetical protein
MRTIRRASLAALFVVVTVLASLFAAGSAGAYPPGTAPTLSLSTNVVQAGGSVRLCGDHFVPGSTVTVALDGTTLATGTAGANGSLCVTVTIPAGTAAGAHTLSATDTAGESATAALTVTAAGAGGGGGGLANTGVAIASIGGLGLLLLIGGGVMLLAGRRRSKVTAA